MKVRFPPPTGPATGSRAPTSAIDEDSGMVRLGGTNRSRRLLTGAAVAALLAAGACTSSSSNGSGASGSGGSPGSTATAGGASGIEAAYPDDGTLRMNQIQVLGSHNSYHIAPPKEFADKLNALIPGITKAWEYTHDPLPVQLADQGVRQVEIDVFADPQGGHYATRHAYAYAGLGGDAPAEMKEPGLKVFHIQELDVQSTCLTFAACLQQVKTWSDANPGHAPVMILVEAKDGPIPDPLNLGFVTPLPIDAAAFDDIDRTIRSVFPDDQVITPDDVRGSAPTLEQAVLTTGWPTMGQARGKVLFSLDNADLRQAYAAGHPSLQGRILFTNATPGEPEAAFIQRNDAVEKQADITELVRKGYLVRTRSDGDTKEARANDRTAADAALASGAQYVSTDYMVPDPALSPFQVTIPGGTPGRCNPVNAPAGCTSSDVENPDALHRGS